MQPSPKCVCPSEIDPQRNIIIFHLAMQPFSIPPSFPFFSFEFEFKQHTNTDQPNTHINAPIEWTILNEHNNGTKAICFNSDCYTKHDLAKPTHLFLTLAQHYTFLTFTFLIIFITDWSTLFLTDLFRLFESALSRATLAQRLEVWHEYISWAAINTTQPLPAINSPNTSTLQHSVPKKEELLTRFVEDNQLRDAFKNDERYIKFCLIYVNQCVAASEKDKAFNKLYQQGVGKTSSLFFTNWASALEAQNDIEGAQRVFILGIEQRAQPMAQLNEAYKTLLESSHSNRDSRKPMSPVPPPIQDDNESSELHLQKKIVLPIASNLPPPPEQFNESNEKRSYSFASVYPKGYPADSEFQFEELRSQSFGVKVYPHLKYTRVNSKGELQGYDPRLLVALIDINKGIGISEKTECQFEEVCIFIKYVKQISLLHCFIA